MKNDKNPTQDPKPVRHLKNFPFFAGEAKDKPIKLRTGLRSGQERNYKGEEDIK